MISKLRVFVPLACLLLLPAQLFAQGAIVPKTNPIPVYVHMMPWFQTPASLGGTDGTSWGWHWTMNNQNPNTILPNGQRQIASNDYPLIGPYDSSDPNVIEYQMLLMKLSGLSGTIVDWYGQQGSNSDEASLLSASNKIVSATQTYGLQVAACLEDRFATSTSEVTNNINYLDANYATQSNYIKVGGKPLMPMFGPITFKSPSQWTTILSGVTTTPAIVPLQYQASQVGTPASGEMAWIYQDKNTSDHLAVQKQFLQNEIPNFSNSLADAYVGYNDFYTAGGDAGAASGFVIPQSDANGQTLTETLDQAQTYYSPKMAGIQVATWNDYGEGTMIEPTVQNGFSALQQIQQFTGVPYGLSQLQFVYQLYEARTELAGNTAAQTTLNAVSNDINNLDFPDAHTSLASALSSAPSSITAINSLTLNGAAALDIANSHMFINYTSGSDPIAAIRAYITTGYNNGTWTGLGIQSSAAAANPTVYGLGYADSADPGNPAGLAPNTIEIEYTLLGDANLDGKVNGTDFNILAANFNTGSSSWDQGDFTYDSAVNGSDFNLLAANFNRGAIGTALDAFMTANGLTTDVPEPASLALISLIAANLFARRRA